jgi:hypothetical protein
MIALDNHYVTVNGTRVTWAQLDAIRPGHALALPGPALSATWDGSEARLDRGDKVLVRTDPWPDAEALRTDTAFADDVATFRAERDGIINPEDPRAIRPMAFLRRFTLAERTAIRTTAASNDSLADWIDQLRTARQIELNSQETADAMQALVDVGVIDAARRDSLLKPLM